MIEIVSLSDGNFPALAMVLYGAELLIRTLCLDMTDMVYQYHN